MSHPTPATHQRLKLVKCRDRCRAVRFRRCVVGKQRERDRYGKLGKTDQNQYWTSENRKGHGQLPIQGDSFKSDQFHSGKKTRSEPISRVLSWTIISLGRRLLDGSSNLPGRCTRRTASRRHAVSHMTIYALLGLASGGVYRAEPVTRSAGALLPHRFTLTSSKPLQGKPRGGL